MINTLGSFGSLVYYSPESFFVNLFLCCACSKYTKKLTPRCIHHRGIETPLCIHHRGVETPQCIYHQGLRLASVFITGESFWTPGSHFGHRGVILDTGESFWTLGSHITDFKEHTTIFKGSIILKIVCRLL